MKNFVRMAALAAVATVAATPASAQVAADPIGRARVNVIKPLSLAAEQDLHFGNVIVWDAGTVQIDRVTGNITCPATLECDVSGIVAQYRVRGTNGYTVTVNTSGSLLSWVASTWSQYFSKSAYVAGQSSCLTCRAVPKTCESR